MAAQSGEEAPIFVAMRVRPLNHREAGTQEIIRVSGGNVVLEPEHQGGIPKSFPFDASFNSMHADDPSFADQRAVYDGFGRPVFTHITLGYNSTVFAYGQTGTGKTHTMMGNPEPAEERGLLLRVLGDLYEEIEKLRANGYQVSCKIRMLEIYNENVQDLLSPPIPKGKERKKLEVHVHPKLGVYVPDLTESEATTLHDAEDLLHYGNTMKTVAKTSMNDHSSRAHTVFAIRYEKNDGNDIDTCHSEVFFVDLAGRENEKTTLAKGDRLVELSFINRSLFHLSQCIHALGTKGGHGSDSSPRSRTPTHTSPATTPRTSLSATHTSQEGSKHHVKGHTPTHRSTVPSASKMAMFRNSKLTLLLSSALSGNSKTSMIGTLSPSMLNWEDNHATLLFAATVKNIKIEAAAKATNKKDLVAELRAEIAKLKQELLEAKSKSGGAGAKELTEKLLAMQKMSQQMEQSLQDAQLEASQAKKDRDAALKRMGIGQVVDFPFLQNVSEDPQLSGKILFHVPEGKTHVVGNEHSNEIVLTGLGMYKKHCTISNNQGKLRLCLAGDDPDDLPRVELEPSGILLKPDSEGIFLEHGDHVILGHAYRFKVIMREDTEEDSLKNASISTQDRVGAESLETLIVPLISGRTDEDQMLAHQYCQHISSMHVDAEGQTAFRSFLLSAQRALRLVDEANTITREVKAKQNLQFQLDTYSPLLEHGFKPDYLPGLCVKLERKVSDQKRRWSNAGHKVLLKGAQAMTSAVHRLSNYNLEGTHHGGTEVVYVWTFQKFTERLVAMRDVYDHWHQDPSYQVDQYHDPWAEFGLVELETKKCEMEEKDLLIKQLREEKAAAELRNVEASRGMSQAGLDAAKREEELRKMMQTMQAEMDELREQRKKDLVQLAQVEIQKEENQTLQNTLQALREERRTGTLKEIKSAKRVIEVNGQETMEQVQKCAEIASRNSALVDEILRVANSGSKTV